VKRAEEGLDNLETGLVALAIDEFDEKLALCKGELLHFGRIGLLDLALYRALHLPPCGRRVGKFRYFARHITKLVVPILTKAADERLSQETIQG